MNEYKGIHSTDYCYDDEYTTLSVACSTLHCCASGFADCKRAYLYHVNNFETDHSNDIPSVEDIWEADWTANPFKDNNSF